MPTVGVGYLVLEESKGGRPLNKSVTELFHMHDKGQVSRMELWRASITFPTIAVVSAAVTVLLLLSNLPSFSQPAYSQTNNTYPGSRIFLLCSRIS